MPASGGETSAGKIIDFGSPDWAIHIGGDFVGAEELGGIAWRWLGAERAWCILPALEPSRDYLLRLHAAPFAPFATDLREFVVASGNQILKRRVVAAREALVQTSFEAPGGRVAVQWRAMPLPGLELHLNDHGAARFEYEQRPDLQLRECTLRHQFLQEGRNVLYFTPNFAVSPDELGTPGDHRRLSFRLFRVELTPLA